MTSVPTIFINNGPLAQLVERFYGIEKVTGSNPVRSTKIWVDKIS